MYGELPSDLESMDETLGPPPAWFSTFYSRGIGGNTFSPQAYASGTFGDREAEIEVNPVERLQELKYKQEMSKKIPAIASRYTDIQPLSPLFREHKAKYGSGLGTWNLIKGLNQNKWLKFGILTVGLFFVYKTLIAK